MKLVIGITSSGSIPLIKGQLKYFRNKGYQVYLMCPESENIKRFCIEENCIHIKIEIVRNISVLKDIKAFFQIILALKKLQPDIVNVGTPKMGLLGMLASYIIGIKKRIYTCRGFRYEPEMGIKRKLLIYSERFCGGLSHKILCISPSLKDKAIKEKIFNSHKIYTIAKGSSNGIDINKFNPKLVDDNALNKLKEELDLRSSFIYGFVGRVVDRKGVFELFQAFNELYQTNKSLRLLIVGTVERAQLRDPDLADHIVKHPGIKLLGWQENTPLYLSLFDVFVLPAWGEGFGTVYIQAAAMGLPIIGSNGTGCKDAVKKDFNALTVEVGNIPQLKECMLLYYNSKDLRKIHGANGIEWSKNFQQEIIWEGLNQLYLN